MKTNFQKEEKMIGIVKEFVGQTVKEQAKQTIEQGAKIVGSAIATGFAIELAHNGLVAGMNIVNGAMKLGAAAVTAVKSKVSKPKQDQNNDKTGKSGK